MRMIVICFKFTALLASVKRLISFFDKTDCVNLAIAPDVLATLVEKGQLHATDFRCLDLSSKQIVWKMFLSLAAAKLGGRQGLVDFSHSIEE
ncbi:hypothetical protein NP603_20890 [Methylomonas sp. SURF-1]|uniref:Uncharacterized protein n=1 Tax=Methylomonas aurea TaxID=2952224 RepID=A0ABT1UMW2_9GAMM|nr:hypothetical protein [Methylomonas sp. SURF-1]MCQ8183577.1 hypothetical protein [Methylomonas sp. SURF-1]